MVRRAMETKNLKMVQTVAKNLLPALESLGGQEAQIIPIDKRGPVILSKIIPNPDLVASIEFLQLLLELIREWAHVYGKISPEFSSAFEKLKQMVVFPENNQFVNPSGETLLVEDISDVSPEIIRARLKDESLRQEEKKSQGSFQDRPSGRVKPKNTLRLGIIKESTAETKGETIPREGRLSTRAFTLDPDFQTTTPIQIKVIKREIPADSDDNLVSLKREIEYFRMEHERLKWELESRSGATDLQFSENRNRDRLLAQAKEVSKEVSNLQDQVYNILQTGPRDGEVTFRESYRFLNPRSPADPLGSFHFPSGIQPSLLPSPLEFKGIPQVACGGQACSALLQSYGQTPPLVSSQVYASPSILSSALSYHEAKAKNQDFLHVSGALKDGFLDNFNREIKFALARKPARFDW
jgi:hypothetical protein